MKSAKRIISIFLCAAMLALFCSCGYQPSSGTDNASDDNNAAGSYSNSPNDFTVTNTVAIKVKNMGTITVELYGKLAPISVEHFMKLVNEKFYDGKTFHRIISGFMVQGGSRSGTSSSTASEEMIKGEFAANGVENNLSHKRGVISMARAQAYDSASTQFFIMHQDNPSLDGQYAAFGKVKSGLNIVDELAKTPVVDSNGTVDSANQPVMESIREVK